MDITGDEFTAKMNSFEENLIKVFAEGRTLETEISNKLKALKYE